MCAIYNHSLNICRRNHSIMKSSRRKKLCASLFYLKKKTWKFLQCPTDHRKTIIFCSSLYNVVVVVSCLSCPTFECAWPRRFLINCVTTFFFSFFVWCLPLVVNCSRLSFFSRYKVYNYARVCVHYISSSICIKKIYILLLPGAFTSLRSSRSVFI